MALRPLCFVLMPFGKKASGSVVIDFDAVYREIIRPAVDEAGLEPLRADEEEGGGIIHKPMFERLVLCDYAVADLTSANANVFYELGVRHAAKPRTTALVFAEGHGRLPFDVAQLRALPYQIGARGKPSQADDARKALKDRLIAAKTASDKDSPLYQLLEDYPNLAHEKTDVFREQVAYAAGLKTALREARDRGSVDEIRAIEASWDSVNDQEAGVLIDLLLSYRALSSWDDMLRLHAALNPILAGTVLVQEQVAMAANRLGRREDAEHRLKEIIKMHGPSSETSGLLGRVYKDKWLEEKEKGNQPKANGFLNKAIETYENGFEADWRDAYPGVNLVTLLAIEGSAAAQERLRRVIPVVRYAVEQKIAQGEPDYWDYASLVELAAAEGDQGAAQAAFPLMMSNIRECWEPETTARNLRSLLEARDEGITPWLEEIVEALEREAKGSF